MKSTNLNVSLPVWMKRYVEHRAASGGYANVSEFVRELIRQARRADTDAELEQALLDGLESPAAVMAPADWAEMRTPVLERHPGLRSR